MPFQGPEIIILIVIALLVFGPKKLPEMGASIGKSVREFRKSINGVSEASEPSEERASATRVASLEREVASHKAAASIPETEQGGDEAVGSQSGATVDGKEKRV
jgi:sec-independent protein translocase protein TatA